MHRREAGFTLIELMVTCAIIAILAAVVLPSFFREARQTKAQAEVAAIFNDMRTRMDQYVQENGAYPATIGEATTWPAAPGTQKQTILPFPAEWVPLKIRLTGNDMVYCGYSFATGLADDSGNIGPVAAAQFGFTAPSVNWYYLFAHCDQDGDAARDAYFFSSSVDPTLRSVDPAF
jgi:prepilin-type N-terminal cleavage/methylation domain-containing protein